MRQPPGSPVRIRGNVLLARVAYLKKKGGDALVESVIACLPPEDQRVMRGKLWDAGFYPFELNRRLDALIANAVSPKDPDRAFLDMGRVSADENLGGAHKVFLTPGDPQRFMSLAPQVYAFYYTVGRRTYEKTGPAAATLKTYDALDVTEADCLTVRGWYERALELCGATGISSAHPQCRAKGAALCEYVFHWR